MIRALCESVLERAGVTVATLVTAGEYESSRAL